MVQSPPQFLVHFQFFRRVLAVDKKVNTEQIKNNSPRGQKKP